MKILVTSTSTLKIGWASVTGSQERPVISSKLERITLSDEVDAGPGLAALIKTVEMLLQTEKPDEVVIVQAGKSRFNNSSTRRPKVEAVIQIACANRNLPTRLVSPQTIAALRKRLAKEETSLEIISNEGKDFVPKDLGDLIGAALGFLPHK